ncbi:replication-relaxation family protein [Streptomyces scabiei]|uniref:replication-relaxation family protein n=1 Tax=Streptomyces scabiei TaxID=1930 RepID=UPI001B31EF28|nr:MULTISPECIES: replication-relaxation family protein [Streptomyces]MDX2684092.1 replication-relaxation family protein [Streptomyces scabiei]MDX2748891.1 replication-relaxation family protein [Streptomyces scabiei]MDX2803080.1 replication-relaxation family protein [Streptomyces scabiei]MDX3197569.1 replication-relaxation family protein [Streptomyces scabiei]MDX3220426.1 replication-relaxation family protein [Streptomyces scabiei]
MTRKDAGAYLGGGTTVELAQRDFEVLKLTRTFSQLASTHITELLFSDRSHAVPDRVLGRLVKLSYLSRVGRRATGEKGGAGAYVYQLGRAGRLLLGVDGRLSRAVNNHSLLIADIYLELRRAERQGVLVVNDWAVERPVPPSVRADLFVSVEYPEQRRQSSYFIEADLGTEPLRTIREKVEGYWQAVEMSEEDYFPYVVFVMRDRGRLREIDRLILRLEEQREMVRTCLSGEVTQHLANL